MNRDVKIIGVNRIEYNRFYQGTITRRKVLLTNAEMNHLKELMACQDETKKECLIDLFCYGL